MVKLTPDLIEQAIQYINPVRDRELLLRGYKIPVVENMGATLDQFDTIDFSDNDLRKFDGFPLLARLKSLHFNNNRICRIAEDVHEAIPNLTELYLTNCELKDLSDLDALAHFKKLEYLSLLRNPVTHKQHYRFYVIHKIPQVRVLDFRRVKMKERQSAKKLFGSRQGKQLISDINKKRKTFTPGAPISSNGHQNDSGMSKKDREAIKGKRTSKERSRKEAILKAKSLEEVEKLKQMLQAGQIPSKNPPALPNAQRKNSQVEEMDED